MKLKFILIISLFPALCIAQVVKSYKQSSAGINVALSNGTLGIYPLTGNSMRIKFYQAKVDSVPEIIFGTKNAVPKFVVSNTISKIEVKTKNMVVILDKQSGNLSFANKSGKIFLREKAGSRKLSPSSVMNESCFIAEQSFESPDDESIFGLGQFQDGNYNLKGVTRNLTQVNCQISLPFIYSNKGYGLLWHQYGMTDFNPADNDIVLEKHEQLTAENKLVEVTTTSGTQKVSQDQSIYTGKFIAPKEGEYSIFLNLGDMGNRYFVVIDGKPCLDQSNMWLPPTVGTLIDLKAGEHQVQVVCKSSNSPKLSWKFKDDLTTFRSPNAKMLDYVVFYGPSADQVVATYRNLSGNVPMLPLWAYGFWQCRERYTSGTHLVETVKEFRKRDLPMDVIVQDWQYWGKYGWGVPKFDETNYPNPEGFIKELHDLNAHFNISVWENLNQQSEIGKEYVAKKLFIPNSPWVDVFNPLARKTHWDVLNKNLFSTGVDSWWMDAVEPENDALHGKNTYLGLGDFYRLTYPLFVSRAVYEGQRATTSDKRVCILTRSAYLGQQRYGVINWSGDIGGTWDVYKRQIVAGLNYTITGMPYWTTDIGGFFRPGNAQYTDEKYHELLTRWFQWGTFNPVFRIHGYQSETEPWKYGQKVENNMRKMLDLRYRLLPYIYSNAWSVSKNGSTIMRPLVMDFREDAVAVSQPYEYMFGKSVLVAPVTEAGVNEWKVYLPKGADWYDFWTGKKVNGGQTVQKEVSLDIIPLYLKAGSILPLGSKVQYATQKKWDRLEIRIYEGANGEFTLYEDENDNYNYEKGSCSTISFFWDEKQKTLTIGKRSGNFTGMLQSREFNIVLVSENKGLAPAPEKSIKYTGDKITVKFK
ncbi:MAG TPA: TIM-barrel domain-containing protein [Paludibacter sp.]|nr:TIM-barrel domain-containing protein [Paludibacter sp.]